MKSGHFQFDMSFKVDVQLIPTQDYDITLVHAVIVRPNQQAEGRP